MDDVRIGALSFKMPFHLDLRAFAAAKATRLCQGFIIHTHQIHIPSNSTDIAPGHCLLGKAFQRGGGRGEGGYTGHIIYRGRTISPFEVVQGIGT